MASSKSFLDYKNTQRKKEKKDEKIIGKYFSSVESERPNPATISTTKSQTEEQSGSSAKSFLDWKVNERKNEVKQNGYERNGVYAFKPSPYTDATDSRAALMDLASQKVAFDRREAARRHQTNGGTMRNAQPTIPEQMLPGSPYIGTENSLGRYGKGNIDLYNRPQYRNPDGSVSTVRSISIGTDDGEVLIPTVGRDANGRPRLMSDDEAIDEYFRTGNNLGVFKSIEEADDYADRLHKQQEAYYTGKGRELPSIEQMANPMRYAETRRQTAGGNSTVESSTVDRMLQAAKQSEARAAEQKEQTYQRNAVNAFGNPNARTGGNWHTTPTGAWGAQDQTGRFVSPQSQRYEQDYRDTDPMRRLAAERVSAQDAENPLNTRGNTKPYSVMTDDEKSVYNYLYSTYGPARAEEYHNGLMDEINRRIGQENYEANTNDLNTAQKAMRSYQQGFSSGIEGILNAPAALMGAENRRARSAAEYENSALRSDQENNTAQKILYDIASSTGNMTPGMMASALGAPAAVGSTLFATSAGGNAYAEAMNAGEDVSTSRAYAAQQFADEEATNWLLGGINAFGGGAVRKVMQNSAAGRTLDAAVNRLVKTESGRRMLHMMMDYVGDMAGEAQQEYVQFYTENFTKAILGMKDESGNPIDFNLNPADPDALYAALLGALNAGALNAAPAAARVIHGSGTDVQNAGGLAEDLRSTTRDDYTSDAAYESAMRLEAVAREIGDRQAAGRTPSAMDRIAFNEAMSEFIEASTEAESESEEENPRTGFVDESGLTLQEITQGARQLREAENRTDAPGAESSEAEPSRMSIPAEMKEQAAYDLLETRRPERIQWTDGTGTFVMQREADEGYSVTNQRGETSGLTEEQAAQMLPADTELTITWGEQRQAEQVKPTVTPESLPSYEASAPVAGINARTENINTGVDNRLMALAQDVTQERTQQKATQMQSVYDAGKNMQAENLRSVMNGATMLTEQEKQAALQRGMQEAVTAARTQTAQATNAAVQNIRIPGVKEGKVSYDPKVDQSKLTEGQKVNAALAGAFASKVFGANVVLTQSNVVNGRYEGANGWFRFGGADDQTFYFDVNAGKNRVSDWKNSPFDATSVMPVIAHEGTHWMEKNHPEAYKGLESQVLDALSKDKAYTRNGELSLDDIISLEQKRMDREEPHADGRPHTVEEAKAELVARGCEDMLNGNEYAKAAFSDLDVEAKKTLWGHIKGVFESIQRFFDELLKNYRSNSQEARAIRRNKEAYAGLLKTYGEILGMGREETASTESQNTLAEELARSEDGVASDGVTMSGETSVQFNERIYEESGRDYLINWLAKQEDITQEERNDIVAQIDQIHDVMQRIREESEGLADYRAWAEVADRNGRLTVITPNGEYPLNIDFATVCKKRKALDHILNVMVTEGDLSAADLAGADIVRLQNIIKEEGLEIACALCFVDSKRYRIGSWADSIVNGENRKSGKKYGYNELVRSLVPQGSNLKIDQFNYTGRDVEQPKGKLLRNAKDSQLDFTLIDKVIAENKPGTWNRNLATALKEHPELRSMLHSAELLSSVGFDPIKVQNPALFDLINNAGGTSKPKLSFGEVPYLNDILMSDAMTPKQAYAVGGVRIQSFSDFMANMVFDYVQMVGELQAKKLPAHAYTKEAAFVVIFGKTGIKINMSLVPKATTWSKQKLDAYLKQFPNKEARDAAKSKLRKMAGLDANGNYIWEDETFPYEVAMHLQADPEYAKNCGTIAVGVSDRHIIKLLNDPTIQMVIPYHKSGINPVVARMRGIDLYTDYTKSQNTRYASGKKISAKDNTFDFYGTLQETGDPKATADAYLKWCNEHGYIPKFEKFRKNPNYYKLLADFRLYDETGAYAPQGPVRGVYPENMKDLILNGYTYTDANGVEYKNGGLKAAQEVSDHLRDKTKDIISQYKGEEKALQDAINSVNESSPNIASEVSIQKSSRITDTELIDRLDKEVESGDYITTYKAMQVIDGELYPPMAAKVKGPDGKYRMQNASKLGEWQQADEDPAHIKIKNGKGYYTLNKGNGKSIDAAYNPYEHSSNLVLNDQFEEAYKRDNLVTVECRIPKSEIDNPYHAEYAKDSTGVLDWKAGVVAGKLKNNKRQVYLSRYLMPVRILEEAEVASMWKDTLSGSDVSVPFNVVSPKLLAALEKAGVSIDYEGSPNYRAHHSQVQHSTRMGELQEEYQEALKENNEDWLLQLVDQAAYEAGYTTTAYHGSPFEDIHVFNTRSDDTKKQANQLLFGTHFTQNLEYAKIYARKAKNSKGTSRMTTKSGQIYKTYLDLGKSLDLRTPTNLTPDTEEYRLYEDAPEKYKKKFPALTFSKYDTEQGLGSGQYITRSTLENVLQAMSPKEATDFLVDHGYDSILYDASYATPTSGNSRLTRDPSIIMLDPERIKSGDPITYDDNGKVIPLSERFNSENEDIRYSMRDSSGQELTEAQAEYFKDSKVRDAEGNLLRVYHGTNAEFYEFDRDRIGAHGSYEGAGFNFTPSSTRAGGYKGIGGGEGRVMEGYLNITNPLSAEKKTMTVRQLAKLIEKIDPTGDDVISNYAQDTRDYGKPSFVRREALYTARQMMNYHDSDADIYADLSASGASTSAIIDAFKTLGYDGLIHYDSEGKINTLIAFDSNQFKNIDNKAPTESADIRHSSRNASADLNLLKAERLSEKYVKELEDTISERDTQIAELQEQMEKAVGAEKEKRKQQLAKLRKEKNDRIAYLEKSYRVNLNWQIAEMRQKMDRAIGEEKAQAKERLDALRAQKNQKIEEILQKNREQREQRRFNRSAQELIKRARRLKKMKGSPTFRAQVDALIGDLDLISPGMKDNTRQRLQKLKEEVDAQAALDPDYAKYEAVKYNKLLDRLKKKQIKDMPLEDIISIAEALAALEHSKKTADREIKEGQGKLFADYGRTAVAQLKKTKGINYGNEIGSMLGKYRLNMLNPTRAFQLLDGYQKGGVFTYFAKELNDGQTRAAEFRQKAEAMFQEIDNNPNLVNDFAKQNIEIMTVEGMKKISKGMRISLYLHAKNLDNVKHISYGGITIPNESLYRRGKYSEAYTAGETVHLIPQDSKNPDMMAAKAIRAITDQMTPEEKQYADIAYKFLNETTKEAINEVSLALDGYEKATVEDYFPIRSDPNFTQASMEGLQKDGTIEGIPMLKERTGSRNPILLEDASQVVLRQKNNTAMYYGLAIPIRNFNRFYNYTGTGFARSVKQSVGKTWGAAGQKYIDNVISDLQFGRQTQRTVLDSMKGLYAGTTLNLNLGVSIKQSASYPFAASVIGWAPLAKALGQRFTAADRAYMDSITPWGYMRRTGFSGTEMGEVARQRTGIDNNQTIQKAKTMLDFIRRVDVATTEKLFKACENYVQEKYPDLEVRGEEYGKKLAEIYNETLQRTQPSYDVMQRNEFLRSQNDLTKVLGAFKTQTFNMGGEILDAYGKWRAHSEYAKIDSSYETMAKESGKAFRTTVAATIVAQAMLVALSAVANAVLHKMKPYRDDKGEVTAESLAKKVMQDFATSFAGLTMGGSEAQAAVMAVFGAEKWYDIEYPGLSMINELVSSITDFSTAVRKSLDKDNAKAAEDRQKASVRLGKVLMQVFKLKGIPSQNLYNIANMVYLHGQDLANDELGSFTAGKGLFGLTDTSPTGKQFAKQAFYYYGKGDVSKGTKAAKRASESGIKDEMGGNQEKAIEYMKKSNLDEKTLKMLWELAGWKANTYDKKMAK